MATRSRAPQPPSGPWLPPRRHVKMMRADASDDVSADATATLTMAAREAGAPVAEPGAVPEAPLDPSTPGPAAEALAGQPASVDPLAQRRRVSRWDRPPEPRDWRWVVGHIGRALITLGLLMFGFVAYQLWGTGIQTARAQHKLESQFEDKIDDLAAAGITSDTFPAVTTATTPASVAPTVPSDTSVTTTTAPSKTTVPAGPVQQDYGAIECGDGIGKITIPKIDVNFFYVACVGKSELDRGVGHFPKSVVPGQFGNAALAGHRTSHKAPFEDLDELEPGDEIRIETILGGAYTYVVTGSEVVDPSDYNVVTDSDPTKATLTLITCTPKFTSKQRLVIHADVDPARSGSPVGVGEIYYGETSPDPSLGAGTLPDDGLGAEAPTTAVATTVAAETTVPADPAATSTTTAGETTTVAATSTTTAAADSATTAPAAGAPQDAGAVDVEAEFADDAFQQGWFDDSAAIPHVLGWGALFGLIWYGSYRFAKRFRNMWLGILVGITPFFVVLYFFYENVNRLLPAAL